MAFLTLFAVLAIVVGLLSYLNFRLSRRRLYELAKPIAGLPELPFLGHAYDFAGSTKDITVNLRKIVEFCYKKDGISKVWLGPKLYIAVNNPVDAETVLNTEMKKDAVYDFMKGWLGNGLISGEVPIWKVHRKMLSPTFNQRVLESFVSIFSEQGEILVNKMSAEIGKGQFDVLKYVSPCTLDVICESAMGVKVRAQENTNTSYIQAGYREMRVVYKRMFQIWLQPQKLFNLTSYARQEKKDVKTLHEFTDNVIKTKRKEIKESEGQNYEFTDRPKYKAFLELMMELSDKYNKLTDAEIREEVDTLTIAGNDTSAHAVSYSLLMLACQPKVQERVVEELREIFGTSDRSVEMEDLPKMQYLERVVKETMRLYPIVPLIVRELTQEVKIRNYTLPIGAGAAVTVLGIHRDKLHWGEDANEFNPDRFLPENSINRHPYCYIPFSAGPRNCIGKQYAMYSIKAIVSTVVRSYKLQSNLDPVNVPVHAEIILKPIDGHQISIEPRTKL